VDTNVSEADIGGVAPGKPATFAVDAYPGERFTGVVKQVRNAPISIQNVVTYDVVVEVDNRDLRLKPGMTANVSILVALKEGVLTVPNAALRFTPPRVARKMAGGSEGGAGGSESAARPRPSRGDEPPGGGKAVWRESPSGDPEAVPVRLGSTDGSATELLAGDLKEGNLVIVGVDQPRGERKPASLPPGFGSGQRPTSPR
jgi:HlyD family secretion protein